MMTGTADRQQEARGAASAFLPAADLTIELHDLPEGRLPAVWGQVKGILEEIAPSCSPDLIVAPSHDDAHQDHRTIGEIVPTVFRDQLYLAYEIPKWDGDLGRPSMYCSAVVSISRTERSNCCTSASRRSEIATGGMTTSTSGLARLRGMECRTRYAEAFRCAKSVILPMLRMCLEIADAHSCQQFGCGSE